MASAKPAAIAAASAAAFASAAAISSYDNACSDKSVLLPTTIASPLLMAFFCMLVAAAFASLDLAQVVAMAD